MVKINQKTKNDFKPKVYTIKSDNDPNKIYNVTHYRPTRWSCTCRDFLYRSHNDKGYSTGHKCKHIKKVQDSLKNGGALPSPTKIKVNQYDPVSHFSDYYYHNDDFMANPKINGTINDILEKHKTFNSTEEILKHDVLKQKKGLIRIA